MISHEAITARMRRMGATKQQLLERQEHLRAQIAEIDKQIADMAIAFELVADLLRESAMNEDVSAMARN